MLKEDLLPGLPEIHYRHRWSRHDLVMWDNRATMHKAIRDNDAGDHRYMRRTTIAGNAPRG